MSNLPTLLNQFAQNYGVDLVEKLKNPLVKKAWLLTFQGLPLEDVEKAFILAIAKFSRFPTPQDVYDHYFLPQLKLKAIEDWQRVLRACGSQVDCQYILAGLSDQGYLALKSVDGIGVLREKNNPYTRKEFLDNWLLYCQQLRLGIIKPLERSKLLTANTKTPLPDVSPEQMQENLAFLRSAINMIGNH